MGKDDRDPVAEQLAAMGASAAVAAGKRKMEDRMVEAGDFVLVPRAELEALRDCTDSAMRDGDAAREAASGWLNGADGRTLLSMRVRTHDLIVQSEPGALIGRMSGAAMGCRMHLPFDLSFDYSAHGLRMRDVFHSRDDLQLTLSVRR